MTLVPSFLALVVGASSTPLGTISFPVSGSAACNTRFTEGILALHSFDYARAHEAFGAAVKADAACDMAHWGDAMAHIHPLWSEEDLTAARAALAKINEGRLSEKERAYVAVARDLFGKGSLKARTARWLDNTKNMRARFPEDDEVALQHALALIVNSERLSYVKRLMQSTAISMEILKKNPNHPGAAHYLIHACDTSEHAILALPAARTYAQIAPEASHARHMPSHIFVQLGMWKEAVASNIDAYEASKKIAAAKNWPAEEYDWHSYGWLTAAYLERGMAKKAEKLLEELATLIGKEDGPVKRYNYSLMARMFVRQTERWSSAQKVVEPIIRKIPLEKGEAEESLGCAMHAPGAAGATRPPYSLLAAQAGYEILAEAAARAGNPQGVAEAESKLAEYQNAATAWGTMLAKSTDLRNEGKKAVLRAWAKAQKTKRKTDWKKAVAAAQALAAIKDRATYGPAFESPARLILGEMLLAAGDAKEALKTFDAVLEDRPNFSRAMLLSARAAYIAEKAPQAQTRYAQLAQQWTDAESGIAGLKEVRSRAKTKMASDTRKRR